MIIKLEKVKVQSRKAEEAINITPTVDELVAKSGVKNGLVNVMTCHTSSGLLVTEGLPCLEEDILTHFARLLPEDEELPSSPLSRLRRPRRLQCGDSPEKHPRRHSMLVPH